MKIGIDATGLFGPRTGIEHYIINVTKCLLNLDKDNQYLFYCRGEIPEEFSSEAHLANFRIVTFQNRKLFQQLRLPFMIFFDKIDLMFFPGNTFSLLCPCPFVITIHDIFPYVIAEYLPKYSDSEVVSFLNSFYWRWMSRLGCKRSTHVISVSQSTKNDIVRVFSTSPHKITVAHLAASPSFFHLDDPSAIISFKKKYALPEPYILCVGTGTHKNLQGSIKSFQIFKKKYPSSMHLLITGATERIRQEILSLIEESDIRGEIKLCGYFPKEDLNLLLNGAKLLLFPSFYEGFGLPVLEAFACGLPVITSDVSSLPEIAGDAAILIHPHEQEEIANALEKVFFDQTLRASMISKGYEQARQFNWESGAKKTLDVFNSLLASGHNG